DLRRKRLPLPRDPSSSTGKRFPHARASCTKCGFPRAFGIQSPSEMKLLLFLGSGVSYESGLPSVTEITRSLLRDKVDNAHEWGLLSGQCRPRASERPDHNAARIPRALGTPRGKVSHNNRRQGKLR